MVPTVSPTATLVLTAATVMSITAKTTWSQYPGLVDIEGRCNLEVALTSVVHSVYSLVGRIMNMRCQLVTKSWVAFLWFSQIRFDLQMYSTTSLNLMTKQ